MNIYLPIAGVAENLFVLLAIGGGVGLLSGLFGVGGGFLMTPLLIFLGIPPTVAVASTANQVLGTSLSGLVTHWRRKTVDVKMGLLLLSGGVAGSTAGVWIFTALKQLGQIDMVINVSFVLLLGALGSLMMIESIRALLPRKKRGALRKRHRHSWMHRLPFKMRFRRSFLYFSIIPPLVIGVGVGVLSAILGVGGGFVMVPAMIYLLEMPSKVVVGTSLLQIMVVSANITLLQAYNTQSVDIILVLTLLASGVIGAQVGTRIGYKLRGEQLRFLLATMILAMGTKIAMDLIQTPDSLYSLQGF